MADRIGKVYIEISAQATKAVNEFTAMRKHLGALDVAARNLQNTMLGVFGAHLIINGISNTVNKLATLDRTMKSVEVISGATGKQLELLEKSAKNLGSATEFGAKSVSELQLQLARLGFSTTEIINSQKAIIDLSIATGEDLAKGAQIAGSTLRAFQLDASEMGRVTDVMASSLNNSALSVDTFGESMKYVAPVAKSAGVSLEELSAMMSVLADAGFSASTMGTSLRRIITLLGKDGKPTVDRLRELASAGLTLADANDEVGLYAQSALLQLTAMMPKVEELTTKYNDVVGATNEMARAMENNLATSIGKARAAWDGWIYSLENSQGTLMSIAGHISNVFTIASMTAEEQRKLNISGLEGMVGGITAPILPGNAKEIADALRKLRKDEIEDLEKKAKIEEENLKTGYKFVGIHAIVTNKQNESLELQVEDLRKKQEALDVLKKQTEELKKQREIQYKSLIDFSEVFSRSTADERTAKLNTPKLSPMGITIPSFTPDEGIGFDLTDFMPEPEEYDSLFAQYGETWDEFTERVLGNMTRQQQAWAFWGNAVSNVIDNVIAKDQDFLKSAAETTARIIDSTKAEIAAYLAKGAAKAFSINPLAAGAIIAVGLSAISGLLKKFANTSDVNTRPTSTASLRPAMVTDAQNLVGIIKGQDLHIVMTNYQRNNVYTTG